MPAEVPTEIGRADIECPSRLGASAPSTSG